MNAVNPADPERLRRINALLEAALALPVAEREAWLRALPPQEQALVPPLRAMLSRAAVETDTFLQRPLALGLDDLADLELPREDRPGDAIGPYRLVRELGAGGMATVWLAERTDGSLQRQEALKLPRSGWALGLARRMARERDILASFEHPRIARLYDAGLTPAGRPWLAMEFVDGVPIDVYCRTQRLDVPQRLRLVLQVADAVAHAHARLVVHRDLKPSNILVTPAGEVRLLDFGVAKLLADEVAPGSNLTQLMGRAVTPDYASPEQVGGRPVGVATDVYSLGVVLHELLTGQRPYRLQRDTPAALEEAILGADVPAASTRVTGDRRLARALRGDIDTILAKAMKKLPADRYRSVEAFAADIERHLAGEPVLAQPDSAWYRLRKAVGRHRIAVTATAAVALALAVGATLALWQGREATRERDQARALLARDAAVNEFFTMLLTEAVPPEHADAVRQMLERGTQMVAPAFGQVPEHEAAILRILSGYFEEPQRGDALLSRAARITRGSPDRTLQAQVDCDRGQTLESLGRAAEAIALIERWIGDPRTPDLAVVHCLQMRGAIAANATDPKTALRLAQDALARLRAAGLAGGNVEADLLGDIGFALHLSGRSAEARPYFEDSLRLYRVLNRQDSFRARVMLSNWGVVELATGDIRHALQRYDDLLDSHARLMSWRPAPSWILGNRAVALERLGRWPQALEAYAQTVRASELTHFPAGERFGWVGQASVLLALGRTEEARQALARADGPGAAAVDAGHPASIRAEWVRARLELAAGRAGDAHGRLTRMVTFLRSGGASATYVAMMLRTRAEAATTLGRHEEARADAVEALALAQRMQGGKPHSDETGLAWLTRGIVEQALGRPAPARSAFEHAIEHLASTAGAENPDLARARTLLAGL